MKIPILNFPKAPPRSSLVVGAGAVDGEPQVPRGARLCWRKISKREDPEFQTMAVLPHLATGERGRGREETHKKSPEAEMENLVHGRRWRNHEQLPQEITARNAPREHTQSPHLSLPGPRRRARTSIPPTDPRREEAGQEETDADSSSPVLGSDGDARIQRPSSLGAAWQERERRQHADPPASTLGSGGSGLRRAGASRHGGGGGRDGRAVEAEVGM
ncbi:hypothetical protein OsJ_19433 [Oryza sativa Japonica Group]|uniref:Uncharacterized protein n=1 Tax=Oryza sativa subsp. japonica TaxID=39947 RepID=B9FLG2_ORYSJ|nr:hypothetical protein OsJ_19433 [Oryza sativa Japonica Group]